MRRTVGTKRSDGFTLLELMIVASILAFGLLTLAAMQLQALRGGSRGRHATTATAIAETQMEQFDVVSWTLLAPTGGWTANVDVDNTVLCGGICGDCDENRSGPDVLDALAGAQIAAGVITPTSDQDYCCDVDASGSITVLDSLKMAQVAVSLSVTLTCP